MARKYWKNDDGARYYTQNIQVNNFSSDALFNAPVNILQEQLCKVNTEISHRYKLSDKAREAADKISCRITTFKMSILQDNWIMDKTMLRFVTQMELEQVEMDKFRLQESLTVWRDTSPLVLQRLSLEKQLAEERSKLELIAGDALLAKKNGKLKKNGTLQSLDGI
jgi:hypothetical protein